MTFIQALNLRPTTRSAEIRLTHEAIAQFVDERTESTPSYRVPFKPLPLADVLTASDALHAACLTLKSHARGAKCDLHPTLDLYTYVKAARAYRAATEA